MASSDRPRGRPRIQETADDVVASVLAAAGPRVSTSAYSTREIAAMVGLSQSLVSRAVRRIRRGGAEAAAVVPGGSLRREGPPLRLVSVEEHDGLLRVVCAERATGPAGASQQAPATGGFRPGARYGARYGVRFERRAAALMAALRVAGGTTVGVAGDAPTPPVTDSDLQEQPRLVVTDSGLVIAEARRGGAQWQGFLVDVAGLLARCGPEETAVPGPLLRQTAARAHRGLRALAWHCDGALPHPQCSDSENSPEGPSRTLSVADVEDLPAGERLAAALRQEVADLGLRPGDRIPPGRLGARAGLGPGAVRGALTQLAGRGLVEPRNPGHAVAAVHGTDVIDVYAARLQLGQVLLRGAADRPRHRLVPLRTALRQLEEAHATGVAVEVDQADLRFQRAVAEVSGLRQSAAMFHELTLRVQMFIAVLQLDYGPVADRILADDHRLLAALTERRGDDAVRLWRGKLDHAVRHMCAIAPERFDAALWNRLSGR